MARHGHCQQADVPYYSGTLRLVVFSKSLGQVTRVRPQADSRSRFPSHSAGSGEQGSSLSAACPPLLTTPPLRLCLAPLLCLSRQMPTPESTLRSVALAREGRGATRAGRWMPLP